MKKIMEMYDDDGIKVELSGVVNDFNNNEYDCVVSTRMYAKIESKTEETPTEVMIEFGVGKIIEVDIPEELIEDTNLKLKRIIKINNESLEKNAVDRVIKEFGLTDFRIVYMDEEVVHSV